MKYKLGITLQFWLGLAVGILAISVCIEVVSAFATYGGWKVFRCTIRWIGRFIWLYEYQTLLTGAAAVTAAWFSLRAVRSQINASNRAVEKQIRHSTMLENSRLDRSRSASRAILPLSLAAIGEYAESTNIFLIGLLDQCVSGILPDTVHFDTMPSFPEEVIAPLKDMIETIDESDRRLIWHMIVRIQIFRSRLSSLTKRLSIHGSIITDSNLYSYIMDAAEVYGRSAVLYDYARGSIDHPPEVITREQMAAALKNIGVFDEHYDWLVERYGLSGDGVWGERYLS